MRPLEFDYTIKYNRRYGINQKRYSCLSILMRIASDTSYHCEANDEKINEFYDPKNYKYLKNKVKKKLLRLVLSKIKLLKNPPSMIKLMVDNSEVPNFIVQECFGEISTEIRNLYKEYVIRFKFVDLLQDA